MKDADKMDGKEAGLDIRDVSPGQAYYTLADARRGGRCVMRGMFIAVWLTKSEAKRAAKDDRELTVVHCLKPVRNL
jgi:hypothetical protein